MVTVAQMLSTYRVRANMQRDGVTNPPENVQQFCRDLVKALEQETPDAEVSFFHRGEEGTDFICGERVLATLPAHEDPKWWRDDRDA